LDKLNQENSAGIVRKPTLDEWFLILQLKCIKKQFHLPFYIDIDVTKLANKFMAANRKVPYTALLIKASSILLEECPHMNIAIFHTFLGVKIVDFKYNIVNLPIAIVRDGKYMLTATTIENAFMKSIHEIRSEIKSAAAKDLSDLPLNKLLHYGKNNFFNRLKLRTMHFMFNNFPKKYLKFRAGGIGVSSLMNKSNIDLPLAMMAYGNTGLTIGSCAEYQNAEKRFLKVGIALDHMVCHGEVGVAAIMQFSEILTATNDKHFKMLTT